LTATAVFDDQIRFIEQCGLSWFTTEKTKIGFCQLCGPNLLWKIITLMVNVSVMAGCLPVQTGLQVKPHIFVDDNCDYHEISPGAPQYHQDFLFEVQIGLILAADSFKTSVSPVDSVLFSKNAHCVAFQSYFVAGMSDQYSS
jgi:hypothetical protein